MFLNDPPATPEVLEAFEKERRESGFLPNLTRLWAWRLDVDEAFMAVRRTLSASTTLTARDQAILVCAASGARQSAYCSLAWGARLAHLSDAATAAGVLAGTDGPALDARDRALADWARKVARDPNSTTTEDVARLRAAGLDDRAIFEATMVAALRVAFTAVNDALGAQPDAPFHAEAPEAVRAVVTYGRPVAAAP